MAPSYGDAVTIQSGYLADLQPPRVPLGVHERVTLSAALGDNAPQRVPEKGPLTARFVTVRVALGITPTIPMPNAQSPRESPPGEVSHPKEIYTLHGHEAPRKPSPKSPARSAPLRTASGAASAPSHAALALWLIHPLQSCA
jgi:hypothetical protein